MAKAGMVHIPNSGEMQEQRQDAPVPGLVVGKFQWETYVNQKVEDTWGPAPKTVVWRP